MPPIHFEQNIIKVILSDFREFQDFINTIQEHDIFIYRGQSSALWPLSSTYTRLFNKLNSAGLNFPKESDLIDNFHLILEPLDKSVSFSNTLTNLEKLAILQHYGTATRLLDFTSNPYVALFFAAKELLRNEYGVYNFAVFALKRSMFDETIDHIELDHTIHLKNLTQYPNGYMPVIYTPRNREILDLFPRIEKQEGLFIFTQNPFSNLNDEFIIHNNWNKLNPREIGKIESFIKIEFWISKESLIDILKNLGSLDKTESKLFPDLEGIARSFNLSQLYT